jgi:D-beta-D-heptose 7-phosphate kinase / D-beta-D-heptose 1-phosphate adenosyltransferase
VPGGSANVAVNARLLGAEVSLVTVVGEDDDGRSLSGILTEAGVGDGYLLRTGLRSTESKRRIVSGGQMLIRLDSGSTEVLARKLEDALVDRVARAFDDSDAVIVSDYGHGVLTPRVRSVLGALQSQHRRVLVVDARDLTLYRELGVTAVKPNYQEAVRLVGGRETQTPAARALWVTSNANRILETTGARIVAVTLDGDGALVLERDRPPHRTYATRTDDSQAIGAGDTFTATFALALAAGAHTAAAGELASAAASVVVSKARTAACTAAELAKHLAERSHLVLTAEAVAAIIHAERDLGSRVVFTNGCCDILHRGHITYLNQAKAFGDVLVVGVNSDDSVRRLKGNDRPINPLEDRVELLAALSCVDYVVPFEEDTPERLIRAVRPDVFVKGGDYTRETLPEARLVEELGGAVQILPLVRDRSTTSVIDQIRRFPGEAAEAANGP